MKVLVATHEGEQYRLGWVGDGWRSWGDWLLRFDGTGPQAIKLHINGQVYDPDPDPDASCDPYLLVYSTPEGVLTVSE